MQQPRQFADTNQFIQQQQGQQQGQQQQYKGGMEGDIFKLGHSAVELPNLTQNKNLFSDLGSFGR